MIQEAILFLFCFGFLIESENRGFQLNLNSCFFWLLLRQGWPALAISEVCLPEVCGTKSNLGENYLGSGEKQSGLIAVKPPAQETVRILYTSSFLYFTFVF